MVTPVRFVSDKDLPQDRVTCSSLLKILHVLDGPICIPYYIIQAIRICLGAKPINVAVGQPCPYVVIFLNILKVKVIG